MTLSRFRGLVVAIGLSLTSPAFAAGNLASKPVTLPKLEMNGSDLSFSTKEYRLETGKYYKLTVASDGDEEFRLEAPSLWRVSWIDQVVVNGIEVKPLGAILGVEFDEAGEADIYFVPLQPGDFEFYVPGFQDKGMLGKFIVR